jgi:hypothetical protein
MKRAALLTMFCLLPGFAAAQSPECRTIPKATDRLACYDKASPPGAIEKLATVASPAASGTKRTAPKQAPDDSAMPLADTLSAENSRLDAKIRNICRGC